MKNFKEDLFDYINESKTAYHAVSNIAARLDAEGYTRLYECDEWKLDAAHGYYVIRDGSSVIAFRTGNGPFMIAAAHSDSPAFRVKNVNAGAKYIKLDTEKYGGLIHYTWLDRPLAVAGRAVVKTESGLATHLVTLDIAPVIPSLAIHMNRTVNDGAKLSLTSDMIPLCGIGTGTDVAASLEALVADKLGVSPDAVASCEMYLVANEAPICVGMSGELVLSPRLDDLACVYSAFSGFLSAKDNDAVPVLAVFDNEEVGSETKQGAASTFLYDVLVRISGCEAEYRRRIASSFMISADNAHASHPNHPELADPKHAPTLGGGIVIKHNANQRYTTDAVSDAILRTVAQRADVAVQTYYNRADMPGGSTLGSIANTKVPVATVDIGIPQLAMHAAVETAALADIESMARLMEKFYSSSITRRGDEITLI